MVRWRGGGGKMDGDGEMVTWEGEGLSRFLKFNKVERFKFLKFNKVKGLISNMFFCLQVLAHPSLSG